MPGFALLHVGTVGVRPRFFLQKVGDGIAGRRRARGGIGSGPNRPRAAPPPRPRPFMGRGLKGGWAAMRGRGRAVGWGHGLLPIWLVVTALSAASIFTVIPEARRAVRDPEAPHDARLGPGSPLRYGRDDSAYACATYSAAAGRVADHGLYLPRTHGSRSRPTRARCRSFYNRRRAPSCPPPAPLIATWPARSREERPPASLAMSPPEM